MNVAIMNKVSRMSTSLSKEVILEGPTTNAIQYNILPFHTIWILSNFFDKVGIWSYRGHEFTNPLSWPLLLSVVKVWNLIVAVVAYEINWFILDDESNFLIKMQNS